MFRVCFPFLLLLLWEARVSAKPQDDRNCRSLASAGYRFWSHYHFPKWSRYDTVWTDWAIFCTLGNHSKLVAKIILPKSPTLLGYFCKIVKIIHIWATFTDIWRFLSGHTGTTWVTNSIAYLDVNIWTEYISRYGDT